MKDGGELMSFFFKRTFLFGIIICIYIYMYLCMKHTLIHHTLSRHMIYSIINSIHIYVLIKYWRELLPLDPCYFFWGGIMSVFSSQ